MTQEYAVICQVLEGNTESFRLIVQRYKGPIVRMIRNITCDGQHCEDIAQEVFLTAYKKLASFDPARSSFSTWLFTIARNKSINSLKKKRPVTPHRLPEQADLRNPCDDMTEKELFDRLDRELQALPARQRRALVLAEFEQLSYEQIAQVEGARIGTIKSRISRAREKLAKALEHIAGDMA